MSLADDLLQARIEAESLMLNLCAARRPGTEFTDPDGVVVTPLVDVFTGPCKVQTTVAQAASPTAGGHKYTVENLQLHFPARASLQTGDVVEITQAVDVETGLPDLNLQGKVFRLVEMGRKTWPTASRWNVELVTA